MGIYNDDISLKLAKAVKQGFLPDVDDTEIDILREEASVLFGSDVALTATYATPAAVAANSAQAVTDGAATGMRSNDTINSWWSKPRSQYNTMRQRIYFTGCSRGGLSHIGQFDLRTRTVQTFPLWAYEADDHNTPAFLIEDDKPPIVIFNRHDQDQSMKIRIGTAPHALDTLGTSANIAFGRTVSYAQIMRQGTTNNIAVLARASDGWWVSRSTDYGVTWGVAFRFYGLGYGTFRRSGGFFHYACTTHPTTVVNNAIRYFKINASTGDITNAAGAAIDNLWTMTTVMAGASMTYTRQSYDTDAVHNTNRVLDVGPSGSVLALQFHKSNPGAGGTYGVYRYATTGATPSSGQSPDDPARGWTFEPIVTSGVPALYYESAYVGGGEFTNSDNEVWLSRESGGVWTLSRWVKSGGVWSNVETRLTRNDGNKIGRPQVPQGGDATGIIIAGDYHYTDPANYWDYYADQLLLKPAA